MFPGGAVNSGNGSRGAVEVVAPAKVNLALHVGPRRPDGYHEIASLMLPVTLADRVIVSRTPGAKTSVECPVAPGGENLAARIVGELERHLERAFEVRVAITKNIPAGAGLGGGSSDAAATLVAMERLFDLDLSPRTRHEIAAAVGSDVPFFLWPGAQLAMGRGQVLKAVLLPALYLVVAVPELSLATAEVYGWHDEDETVDAASFVPRARMLSRRCQEVRSAAALAQLVHNDLEPCVVRRRPEVGAARDALVRMGARVAAMTGSGAAVFGLFDDADAAARARAAVAPLRAWSVTDLQPAGA
ncbi:MAG: 4-(cytidine 5'-diphospho)-2-C-methyl-D-erythritol kinase [Thermoleophilia bacterium]